MMDTLTLVILGVVLFLTYYYMKGRRPVNFPPGPHSYPFVGNLNIIYNNKNIHKTFHGLAKQFGQDVFGLQLGIKPTVVISDIKVLKKLFIQQADNFSVRPQLTLLHLLYKGKGIVFNKGEPWKILRKVSSITMRDFGVGKLSLQDRITEEAEYLTYEIEKHGPQPIQLQSMFQQATTNIVHGIVFGTRLPYTDTEYQEVQSAIQCLFVDAGLNNIFLYLPAFSFALIPFFQTHVGKSIKASLFIQEYVKKRIEEHRKTFNPEILKDLVDLCLDNEQKDTQKNIKPQVFTDDQIKQIALDLFSAGGDTTAAVLYWAIYFLVKYPHIQTKCRQEIQQVLADDNPTQNDRKRLPFVEATICEVMRCGYVGPVTLWHTNETEAEVCGYKLAPGTIVLANMYTIFNNQEYFPEPSVFNPSRFLDEYGELKTIDAFVPFGLGRRSCSGEHVAKLEIFLFLTTLLQKFEFSVPDAAKLPSVEDTTFGLSCKIQEYEVVARRL